MKQNVMKTFRLLAFASILFTLVQCQKEARNPDQSDLAMISKSKAAKMTKTYKASLTMLNNSGVQGTATLMLNGDMLTVTVDASGLTPNMVHPQHIHGFMDNNKNAKCPTMAADTDGDGLISLAEGLPYYGPVLLPLSPFPTADAQGMIHYEKSFTIDKSMLPLQNDVIVLHGMMVDGSYAATLPVACGQIMPAIGQGMQ